MRKLCFIVVSTILLNSCNTDDGISINTETSPIEKMLVDFMDDNVNSRSKSIHINRIDRQNYVVTRDSVYATEEIMSRSGENESDYFEMSTVEFSIGDNQGYAVLSDDPRIDKIYFFTEEGCINDTVNIKPLKEFIDMIPVFASDEVRGVRPEPFEPFEPNPGNPDPGTPPDYTVNPITTTKWGQGYPYNRYGKECTCSDCSNYYSGHNPIGCVTVATAQAIAKCGKFHGTFYGNKDIDFTDLTAYSYPVARQYEQIAHFFHEVALCCQIKFGCSGSGSTLKAAYQYLKDLGYSCTYYQGSITPETVKSNLSAGRPHLIAGGGHMWLIDGIKRISGKYYYNCNWGWSGSSNGWSYGNPYTATTSSGKEEYSSNLRQLYINAIP